MLKICEEYAQSHSILFNSSKTKCMFFHQNANVSQISVQFIYSKLSFVDECILLGLPLESLIFNANISQSVESFYVRINSVIRDFRLLPYDIQFSLLSNYCINAYWCQLWNYSSNSNERYYCEWRKVWRHMWCIPYTNHDRLITIIFKTKSE